MPETTEGNYTAVSNVIRPDDMTVEDILSLGPDYVNDRLPLRLLIQMSRRYVVAELNQRERREALAAERRAWRQANVTTEGTDLDSMILAASMDAAHRSLMNWYTILDVPFKVPGTGIQTTWGVAVIDEHRTRAEWLEALATGDLRTAMTHRRAIYELDEAGADTLRELVHQHG